MPSLIDEINAAALIACEPPNPTKNETEQSSKNEDIPPSPSSSAPATDKTKEMASKKTSGPSKFLFDYLKCFEPTPEQQKWQEFTEKRRKSLRLPTLFELKKAKMLSDRKKNLGY